MSYASEVGNAIKGGFCEYLRAGDNAARLLNELSPVGFPNVPGFWRPRLCDDNPADVPAPASPATGGQCPGVQYKLRVDYTNAFTGEPKTSIFADSVLGPASIGSAEAGEPNSDGQYNFGGTFVGSDGEVNTFTVTAIGATPSLSFVCAEPGCDNSCGDAPSIPPSPFPPEGDIYDIDITYEDNSGDTVEIDGTVNINIPVVVGPNIFVPIRVDLGGITFDGRLEIAPNFEFNFGGPPSSGGPGAGDPAPPVGDPDNPGSDDPDIPSTPEDKSTRQLIGAIVTSTPSDTIQASKFPQDAGPTLYLPRIGSLYFRVRSKNGLSWFGPVSVQQRRQFVPAPDKVASVSAVFWEDTGWSSVVTLVYEDSRPPV